MERMMERNPLASYRGTGSQSTIMVSYKKMGGHSQKRGKSPNRVLRRIMAFGYSGTPATKDEEEREIVRRGINDD